MRLAAAEKAYAEQVRELTKKEMEMAEKEFAMARLLWERIKIGVKKTEHGEGRCRTSENERERNHREEREKTEALRYLLKAASFFTSSAISLPSTTVTGL